VRRKTRWPAHRITTAHLQAAYPFVAEGGLGSRGVYIGRDLYGGAFVYDPWTLYSQGIHGPNMLVFGQIGYAKSSLSKTYLWRQMLFGKTAWIVDPKGEYDTLAHACGTDPIRFVSGGSLRLNPLDPAIGGDAQLVLLRSIAEVMLGRALAPEEDAALERAHMEVAREAAERGEQAIVPEVVKRLLDPSLDSAEDLRTSQARLAEDGRQLGLGLRRMGSGDLRGMFDGPTSKGLDLSGRLVSFNLREVNDAARPILMACTAAWLQGAWARNDGIHRIVVLDEAWVILRHLAIARWLRESWKLARSYGVQCVAVMHRLSDLTAAGDEGSEQVQLAKGLLEDSETRVIYRQSWGEVEKARELLGLTQIEVEQIPNLQRGEALWRVGQRSFIVQHRLSPIYERELVDTDANMNVRPSAVAGSPLVPADTEPPVALDLGPPPEGDPLEADLDPSRPYQS
jgi:type IV secretory pathway VirB4 component